MEILQKITGYLIGFIVSAAVLMFLIWAVMHGSIVADWIVSFVGGVKGFVTGIAGGLSSLSH